MVPHQCHPFKLLLFGGKVLHVLMGALFKGSANVFFRISPKTLGMRSLESFNGWLQFPVRVCLASERPPMILERVGMETSENFPRVLEMKYSGEGLDRNLRELEVLDESSVLLWSNLKRRFVLRC
jgi:hypothetical protein